MAEPLADLRQDLDAGGSDSSGPDFSGIGTSKPFRVTETMQ
jgi:hypothetical protein